MEKLPKYNHILWRMCLLGKYRMGVYSQLEYVSNLSYKISDFLKKGQS